MTHEDWHLRSSGYGRSVCNFFDNICGRRCWWLSTITNW
jgi:hypothetical protein